VRFRFLSSLAGCALAVAAGCFGSGPQLVDTSDQADASSLDLNDGSLQRTDVDLGDPFALEGAQPSHGPFTGGTRVVLGGRGFNSHLRVFVGATEVPPTSVLASDPTRAAIVTPPGPPGPIDLRIRDDATATERVLAGGFSYDPFVVTPSSGATSGGTRVRLSNGDQTHWIVGSMLPKVQIDGKDCSNIAAVQPATREEVECTTMGDGPGPKDVTVIAPDGTTIQVREAYTYSDSPDGYRGGLTGGALSGQLHVLAYDSLTGLPIPGAYAIAGSSLASAIIQHTGSTGVAEISGVQGTSVTVTVAAKCHQPITFVAVPVDTVTAYLPPVFDPSCAMGDPPSTGGNGGIYGGIIEGQLVFPGMGEFQRAGWSTVPTPTKPTERRAAYVFAAAPSPSGAFQLPAASDAITPETGGGDGYTYSIVTLPGNATIYAVAGLEDRSNDPPTFVPYAMGVARGITVPSQTRVTGVDLKMDILFDHELDLVPQPPAATPRGPDRIETVYSLTLGSAGYAILPMATRLSSLPPPMTMPFVGVPALDHGIAGEQYVLGAVAATGPNLLRPASAVTRIRTTDTNAPVVVGGFLGIPVPGQPGTGTWNGTHVELTGGAGVVDLTVLTVGSGGGLSTWTMVAPGLATSFDVPDLAAVPSPDQLGLYRGEIATTVYVARIDGFTYENLRYGNMSQGSWNAYAFDSLGGTY
jgi:hypothetical protein